VTERSNPGIAHALKDGLARVASAPVVAIGLFAVVRLLDLPAGEGWTLIAGGARRTIVTLLFWAFAFGGILDRYARDRPTRATGFFAACGRHVMPLTRMAILPLAVALGLIAFTHTFLVGSIVAGIVDLVLLFARVRLVVEDRRSAVGSLLASVRFIRRNLGSVIGLCLVYGIVVYALSAASTGFETYAPAGRWSTRAIGELFLALTLWLRLLVPYAVGIALFQSRLAHAGYTAAPPAVWPESAAAEAISNGASISA